MSSSTTYTKIKTGIADIDKKSKYGQGVFTFKTEAGGKSFEVKSVKNQREVMAFIEKYIWNLDFPAISDEKKAPKRK